MGGEGPLKSLLRVIKAMDGQTDNSMVERAEESSGPSTRDREHGRDSEEKTGAHVTDWAGLFAGAV